MTKKWQVIWQAPNIKKEVVASATDREWFGGDTLQAAIGQSYSLFTPIQLANYAATIANGGTRYKVNLIKSVRSSVDGGVVKKNLIRKLSKKSIWTMKLSMP